MTPDDVSARLEIMHLISTYTVHADQGQFDKMAWIWAEDAVVLPPGGARIEGRDAIMARFKSLSLRQRADAANAAEAKAARDAGDAAYKAKPPITFARHNITTTHIELLSSSEATGRSYFFVVNDGGFDHCGVYIDKFRKVDGKWLIAERKTRLDYMPDGALFGILRPAMLADREREGR